MTTTSDSAHAIERAFARRRDAGVTALIPFLAACDPEPGAFVELAVAVAHAGADVLEVGLPYADSLADGPVIQAAYARALAHGGVDDAFAAIRRVAARTDTPIVLMTAYNPIHARGAERFVAQAADSGVEGLIVPDLPPEDGVRLRESARVAGLASVLLVAPDTPQPRMRAIALASSGFLYMVRRRGLTGASGPDLRVRERIAAVRALTATPIALGFGIATPDDARAAAAHADGVIVGSALIERIAGARGLRADPVSAATELVASFRAALDARAIEMPQPEIVR